MVAFLALHYAFYPLALIVFGVLLRTGVLNGKGSVELTIVPAGVAGLLLILGVLIALIPPDLERRLARFAHGERSRDCAAERRQGAGDAGRGLPLRRSASSPIPRAAGWR